MYVTESARLQGEGKYIGKSWYDLAHGATEDMDAEQIISDVVERAGIRVVSANEPA